MTSTSSGGRGLSFSIGGLTPAGALSPAGAGKRVGSPRDPLRVLVVADCSGREGRGLPRPLVGHRARRVDALTLEAAMAGWKARVSSGLFDSAGEPVWLDPRSLDDLHPDRLLETLAPLSELVTCIGSAASDPAARARLGEHLGAAGAAAVSGGLAELAAPAASPSVESSADTLSRLLGSPPAGRGARPTEPRTASAQPAPGRVDLSHLIRAIVGQPLPEPVQSPADPAALAALLAAAQAELAVRLRAVLRAPAVRKLEATWRGIDGLCRSCPDEELVLTFVLDASFEELAADASALAAVLDDCAPSVLLVDEVLSDRREPLLALSRLLEACRARDVLLLAGAHAHLAGCAHFEELSQPEENEYPLPADVREPLQQLFAQRDQGARLALALPRFLLRQPYGASGEPIEHFPFEEVLAASDHEAFPWGNGAYLVARALARRHVNEERVVFPDGSIDVRELPVVYLENDGESRVKPCAEAWLSERTLGRLRGAGFSVLQGMRDTDRVRVHL